MSDPHPRHRTPYANVLETIAWTPLIRLSRVTQGIKTPVYGKAEFFNPAASVKDRLAISIIEEAERSGELKPGLAQAYMYRGVLFVQQGEMARARADLSALRRLDRSLADALAAAAKAPDAVVDKIKTRRQIAVEEIERITGRLKELADK